MHTKTTRKTTLITGANRGLGLELARAFLAADHQVVATARFLGGHSARRCPNSQGCSTPGWT